MVIYIPIDWNVFGIYFIFPFQQIQSETSSDFSNWFCLKLFRFLETLQGLFKTVSETCPRLLHLLELFNDSSRRNWDFSRLDGIFKLQYFFHSLSDIFLDLLTFSDVGHFIHVHVSLRFSKTFSVVTFQPFLRLSETLRLEILKTLEGF